MQRNLTHQLVHDLGLAIVQGEYAINAALPSEADICKEFGVSRSATREAVKMLAAKGLLTSRPRHGIRVLPESHWNTFDTEVLGWLLHSNPSLDLLLEFTQIMSAAFAAPAQSASTTTATVKPFVILFLIFISSSPMSVSLRLPCIKSSPLTRAHRHCCSACVHSHGPPFGAGSRQSPGASLFTAGLRRGCGKASVERGAA